MTAGDTNRNRGCRSVQVDFMRSRSGDVMLLVLRMTEKEFPFIKTNVCDSFEG